MDNITTVKKTYHNHLKSGSSGQLKVTLPNAIDLANTRPPITSRSTVTVCSWPLLNQMPARIYAETGDDGVAQGRNC